MRKPNWKKAPEWANWWAIDQDGNAYWYARKPDLKDEEWYPNHGKHAEDKDNNIDWTESLKSRGKKRNPS